MLRPDKRPQYPRIYCNLEDPKYDLFAQYWIRVAKTLGLTAKMTLVAEARKKQTEAQIAASVKPYTTAQSSQLRQILMNAASGPLIISRLSWVKDKKALLHGLYPEMLKEPGKITTYKRLLFSHKDFWLHWTHRAQGALYKQSHIELSKKEYRLMRAQEEAHKKVCLSR